MTIKILTATTALALILAAPAMAEANRTSEQDAIPSYTGEEIKEGYEKTKKNVSDAADEIAKETKDAYKNVKKNITGDKHSEQAHMLTDEDMSKFVKLLGEPVYNQKQERIAKVKDIIVDKNGDARMVVLGDGDFTGLGKTVAFDYGVVTQKSIDGDIISPLSEADIDRAAKFSYEKEDVGTDVRIMPANGYSMEKLTHATFVNNKGENIANVDMITMKQGRVDSVIIAYNEIFGMGGKKAAIDFDKISIMDKDGAYKFHVNAEQAKKIESLGN